MADAHRHDPDPSVEAAALHEVAAGVHSWVQPDGTWWINNTGAVIGETGALIVDTCATADRTRRFLDAVRTASGDAPVRFAVNTHEHGDHTYGNWLLPVATTLVGHPNMRAGLAADFVIEGCPPIWDPVPDWGAPERRLPEVTVTDGATVHLGDRAVEIHHPGHPAHTTGDLVIWVPDERVLFTGDLLFAGLTPLVMAGSIEGARHALEWIAGFEPSVVVPGHGPVVPADLLPSILAEHERYYLFVAELADQVRRSGHSIVEVARDADLGPFADWDDAERLVLNLHRAVADDGGPSFDVLAAFTDTIEWNGGPLTTHVCCVH